MNAVNKAPIVSIIVPTWNEEGNIRPLIERIDTAMRGNAISYQVIFVDDRSTDRTREVIFECSKKYPVSLLLKKRHVPRGKAQSLIAGFGYAEGSVLVMLDADLQYPPEAIADMLALLQKGADIVVADRIRARTPGIRKLASMIYRTVFGKLLHGFDCDIQSGLKMFRREVATRIPLTIRSPWMFDLELLLGARTCGFRIESLGVTFDKRLSGKAKISLFWGSIEMAIAALALKMKGSGIVAFHPDDAEKSGEGFHFRGKPYVHYSKVPHHESAFIQLTVRQRMLLTGLLLVVSGFLLLDWHGTLTVALGLLTLLYFLDLLFNSFLVYRTFTDSRELQFDHDAIEKRTKWPMYTVLCPLYREWRVIPQFIRAMSQIDYPKDKLQVMLILEENDTETISEVKKMALPDFFDLRIVPDGRPKTKPKALNYGHRFARGQYAVVYDAEDIPEPSQLKKAVMAFDASPADAVCVQAKLNFYNPAQNVQTRLFTAEYSLWFDLVLPGLQSLRAPIPLGGTSNHFRVSDLVTLGGWDAFNVTEDCDLGMRLAKQGFQTVIVDSTTMEEANSNVLNWYAQRSRWIKGYIQTYLVHMRDLGKFKMTRGKPDGLTFQLVVGGKILSMFINPLMWVITISYFAFRPLVGEGIESFYPWPILYMGALCLVFGNFLYMYTYMIGCMKRGYFDLIKYALITPFYWLAMSVAAWRAFYEIIVKPHYWNKTVHGLHLGTSGRHAKKAQGSLEHVLSDGKGARAASPYAGLPSYLDILQ